MAWTTPRTWVAGELVTASMLNTHIRDNLNALAPSPTVITTTGTQTALAIPSGRGDLVIFANNPTLLTVQGITAGFDGQRLTILSIGAGQVDFAHQNGSATAANRLINFATVGLTSLAAGSGVATYVYDANPTAQRWRLDKHEQGAWISPAFSAGDFTSNTGSWAVGSGDVVSYAYRLSGRTLTVVVTLQTTTVSGSPVALQVKVPGGFTSAKEMTAVHRYIDNGTPGLGLLDVAAAGTNLLFYHTDSTVTWANATNATNVVATITFEVQ